MTTLFTFRAKCKQWEWAREVPEGVGDNRALARSVYRWVRFPIARTTIPNSYQARDFFTHSHGSLLVTISITSGMHFSLQPIRNQHLRQKTRAPFFEKSCNPSHSRRGRPTGRRGRGTQTDAAEEVDVARDRGPASRLPTDSAAVVLPEPGNLREESHSGNATTMSRPTN